MASPFWKSLRGWLLGEEEAGSTLWAVAFTLMVAIVPALLSSTRLRGSLQAGHPRPPASSSSSCEPDRQDPREAERQEAQPRVPEHLQCPVTHTLFRDPVFVVDSGNTYDREPLMDYWDRVGVARDPLTNLVLASSEVRTNWGVRREVQALLNEWPDYVPEGWDSRELLAPDQPRVARAEAPAPAPAAEDAGPGAEPALPEGAHDHCAAMAAAAGGTLGEETLTHLAQAFRVDVALLRQRFGQGRQEEQRAEGAGAAEAALPARIREHCALVAQTHGGHIPESLLGHLAINFGVDEAALRAAYGRPEHVAPAA